jgi:hypothetical protein
LCAVDTQLPALALQALLRSMRQADFARVLLFTHGWMPRVVLPQVELVEIEPLFDAAAEAAFVRYQLPAYVRSSHLLLTRWDASVLHPRAWTDEFLVHDHVGDGAVSLRSRRLLRAGLDTRLPEGLALHQQAGGRELLQQLHGVSFAPPALAQRFAVLDESPSVHSFAAAGAAHLPHVLPEADLIECLQRLPATYFASDMARLSRALAMRGMPTALRVLLKRCEAAGRTTSAAPLWAATASMMGLLGP